jgi:hypothetical protein
MWATWPHLASSGYPAEFHKGCYRKHTNPLNCRTSSSDISSYHVDFYKRHDTVGERWVWHGMCELALIGASPLMHEDGHHEFCWEYWVMDKMKEMSAPKI